MTERSDTELVEAVLSGQKEAFGELVDRHRRMLFALALQRGFQAAEAEDIAQETFFKAYRSLKALRDKALFERWLYGIACHVMADRRRTRKRHPEEWGLENAPEPQAPVDLRTDLGLDEERSQVLEALGKLSEEHRLVLSMRYLYDLSPKQISERLKAPRGTIRSRLHHALAKLQRILRIESTTAVCNSDLEREESL